MGFFDEQDREDKREYKKMVVYFVAAVSVAMLLFLIIILINTNERQRKERVRAELMLKEAEEYDERMIEQQRENESLNVGKSDLKSEDLDFWDMYEVNRDDEDEETVSNDYIRERKDDYASDVSNKRNLSDNRARGNEARFDDVVSDNSIKEEVKEGKIKAASIDGKEDWYDILEDAAKHRYSLKENLFMEGDRLTYKDRRIVTNIGVDVSKYQGTIDWDKVKADGIDFAIIRLGARGYGSGLLKLDEKYIENITAAKAAGLKVGVYIYSQATSEEEAVEEANFAVGASMNYDISYPIVYDVEWVEDDEARTDDVDIDDRTGYAVKFCETVEAYGYTPMIYATRDMFIAGMNMDELTEYAIWLQDDYEDKDGTDFPYRFDMWQYSQKGKVDGISGNVDLNISFTDYRDR